MANIFTVLPPHAPAQGPLARYRVLSPSAGVRVSPLTLGSMNFGDNWASYSKSNPPRPPQAQH